MNRKIKLDRNLIADFCARWRITELSVFGSALREDFRDDSDVDVLVSFSTDADWSLMDHAEMELELASLLRSKSGSREPPRDRTEQQLDSPRKYPVHRGTGLCRAMTRSFWIF